MDDGAHISNEGNGGAHILVKMEDTKKSPDGIFCEDELSDGDHGTGNVSCGDAGADDAIAFVRC